MIFSNSYSVLHRKTRQQKTEKIPFSPSTIDFEKKIHHTVRYLDNFFFLKKKNNAKMEVLASGLNKI